MNIVQETSRLIRLTRFGMINCFLVKEDDTGLAGSAASRLEFAISS